MALSRRWRLRQTESGSYDGACSPYDDGVGRLRKTLLMAFLAVAAGPPLLELRAAAEEEPLSSASLCSSVDVAMGGGGPANNTRCFILGPGPAPREFAGDVPLVLADGLSRRLNVGSSL